MNNDHNDQHIFGGEDDYSHLEEKSALSRQKKMTKRGGKLMGFGLIGIAVVAILFVIWNMVQAGQSDKQANAAKVAEEKAKDAEPSSTTAKPTRNFAEEQAKHDAEVAKAQAEQERLQAVAAQAAAANNPMTDQQAQDMANANVGIPAYKSPYTPQSERQPEPSQPVISANTQPVASVESPLDRQLASDFRGDKAALSGGGGSPAINPNQLNNPDDEKAGADNKKLDVLNDNLKPAIVRGELAKRMVHRDYMLSAGNMIDCVMETKFNSTLVGMLSCNVTRNIYSTNGRVVLVDRGSRVIGEYKSGLMQGQRRVFVLWTRLETPKGVIMQIDSPAAGQLGESGMNGRVNSNFWARFGGALLVSVVDGIGKGAGNAAGTILTREMDKAFGGEGEVGLTRTDNLGQGGTDVATEVIKQTINIPPTLIKHQGDRISIYVARDLDFTSVYRLKTNGIQ